MIPNVLICESERDLEAHFRQDFIAHIDGKSTPTLRKFYEEIADLLEIPDFGFTLESLNDALNDLSWLEDERIILYVTNTNDFISKERDPAKIGSLLSMLDATAEDWKWLNDEDDAEPKELVFVFENSARIRQILDNEAIRHLPLTALNQ